MGTGELASLVGVVYRPASKCRLLREVYLSVRLVLSTCHLILGYRQYVGQETITQTLDSSGRESRPRRGIRGLRILQLYQESPQSQMISSTVMMVALQNRLAI